MCLQLTVSLGKLTDLNALTMSAAKEGISYYSFPTIFWVPKGKKGSPIRYNGGRELDDFIKYVAKESTSELNGWSRDGKKKSKQEL